jgi:kynurenine formamidase
MKFVDLSQPIRNGAMEPQTSQVIYHTFEETARERAKKWNISMQAYPTPGLFIASETVTASTHSATHMDAPYHYGPSKDGSRTKTIDEIPLEWCFNDGIVLDFTDHLPEQLITAKDIAEQLKLIGYEIKPLDIVLIRTDADKYYDDPEFDQKHAGLSRDAVFFLTDSGVKIVGTDGWGVDSPTGVMREELRIGHKDRFYPAHFAGREVEYLHVEKMANLDQLPPFGFKVSVFPIKIEKASGGWVRAVALL